MTHLLAFLSGVAVSAAAAFLVARLADRRNRLIAERGYVRPDPEIGWVGRPHVCCLDFFGPGRTLTLNGLGFRGRETPAPTSPAPVLRVVCSGDSFTFGYGVDDADAWPARLAAYDERIEVINMGLGGFGIQQSYLWFLRDGVEFRPDVHLLGVVSNDFERMRTPDFFGYPRPMVVEEGGVLRVRLPRPKNGYLRALDRLAERLAGAAPTGLDDDAVLRAFFAMAEDLERRARAGGGRFGVLYLPVLPDDRKGVSRFWRDSLRRGLDERGIPFLDLAERVEEMEPAAAEGLFIRPGEIPFLYAEWHLNEAGNRFVAEAVRGFLETFPEVAGRLNRGGR